MISDTEDSSDDDYDDDDGRPLTPEPVSSRALVRVSKGKASLGVREEPASPTPSSRLRPKAKGSVANMEGERVRIRISSPYLEGGELFVDGEVAS